MAKMTPFTKKNKKKDDLSEEPQVEELLKNLEFHQAIQEISNRILEAETISEILLSLTDDIRDLFNIHTMTIYVIDRPKKEIYTLEGDADDIREIRSPMDFSTFAGYVALKKKMLYIPDPYNERELRKIHEQLIFDRSRDIKTGVLTGQVIVIPLFAENAILGIMEIHNKKGGEKIEDYHQIFLDEIASVLARALDHHLNFEQEVARHKTKFDYLFKQRLLTDDQLEKALRAARSAQEPLENTLLTRFSLSKYHVGRALAEHYRCQFIGYSDEYPVPDDLLFGLDRESLEKMKWVPLNVEDGKIQVLIDDPTNMIKRKKIEEMIEADAISYSVALASDIMMFIERFFLSDDLEAFHDIDIHDPLEPPVAKPAPVSQARQPLRTFNMEDLLGTQLDDDSNFSEIHVLKQEAITEKTPEPVGLDLHPETVIEPEIAPVATQEEPPKPEPVLPPPAVDKVADTELPKPELISSPEPVPQPATPVVPSLSAAAPAAEPVVVEAITPVDETQSAYVFADTDSARMISYMIHDAYGRRASDLHIEPDPESKTATIRIRVEGRCIVHQTLGPADYETLKQQIRTLTGLESAPTGAMHRVKVQFFRPTGDILDLRVSLIPTLGGMEDAVIQILAKTKKMSLELIGLSQRNYETLTRILEQPRGLVLLAGPTGSGITTSLHACLGHINQPGRKIWTAEAPIEITQHGLRQIQIDPKKGFTYPRVLKTLLDADPDVIMAGRIDDLESAGLCVQAALADHLVLSSLPADNMVETLERLLDMGIHPLPLADAVLAVVSQRLIETLCPKCKEKYTPSREEYDELAGLYGREAFEKLNIPYSDELVLYRPKGCDDCGQTGYGGRTGIHEICVLTHPLKRMIRRDEDIATLYTQAVSDGMVTLLQDWILKAMEGHTDSLRLRQVLLA